MTGNGNRANRGNNMVRGLAIGWVTEAAALMLGCGILTTLVLENVVGWRKVGYGVMIILLVASYCGAAAAANKAENKRQLICILSGIILLLTLGVITMLFYNGRFEGSLMTAMIIAGGSTCASLVHCAEKRGKSPVRQKRRL